MPTLRPLSFVLAVFVCAVGGAVAAQSLPEPTKAPPAGAGVAAMPDIEFYLAHGEADACGRGCNEWIVAEGKIDAGAAQRLRRLLTKLGAPRPPIYFHSLGGQITGSLELGRLIRDQKLVVSVAHTIPLGCDRDQPLEKSCAAQKRAGGAAVGIRPEYRHVQFGMHLGCSGGRHPPHSPWVNLGIHDMGFDPAKKQPRGALADEVRRVLHAHPGIFARDGNGQGAVHRVRRCSV